MGRAMLVHRTKPLPVECVVRGYVAGSGWKDYQKTQDICGIAYRWNATMSAITHAYIHSGH